MYEIKVRYYSSGDYDGEHKDQHMDILYEIDGYTCEPVCETIWGFRAQVMLAFFKNIDLRKNDDVFFFELYVDDEKVN